MVWRRASGRAVRRRSGDFKACLCTAMLEAEVPKVGPGVQSVTGERMVVASFNVGHELVR